MALPRAWDPRWQGLDLLLSLEPERPTGHQPCPVGEGAAGMGAWGRELGPGLANEPEPALCCQEA